MKKLISIILILTFVFVLASCEPIDVNPGRTETEPSVTASAPLEELTEEKVGIVIEVRDFGTMKFDLYPNLAPLTVRNFLAYVDRGFYDGLTFHRVKKGFVIQGGDPNGDGTGGGDLEALKGEFAENGIANDLSHQYGVISMARTSLSMDSATSQFFICNADASADLDGKYAAFGKLTEGSDVLDAISNVEVTANVRGEMSVPVTPIIIEKIYRAE